MSSANRHLRLKKTLHEAFYIHIWMQWHLTIYMNISFVQIV